MSYFIAHSDPAVQAFINADPHPEAVRQGLMDPRFAGPKNKKLEACLLLLDAAAGLRSYADIDAAVQEAYAEPSNADRHLVFLICWIRSCLFRAPIAQVQVLLAQASQLLGARTPAELRSWVVFLQMVAQFEMGNTVAAETIARDVLVGLSPESPHYRRIAELIALDQLALGKGNDAQTAFPELMRSIAQDTRGTTLVNVYMGCAMTGDLEGALAIAPALAKGMIMSPHPVSQMTLNASHQMMALMAERAGRAIPHVTPVESSLWVQSTRALLKRQPEQALELARTHSRQNTLERSSVVGPDQYCLIRAELACGNGDAALRLIMERHERGTAHYFDDFFVARAQLLLGQQSQAAQSMARVYQAVQRYRAEGRLEFELALACELPTTTLLNLLQPVATDDAAQRLASTPVTAGRDRRSNGLIHADPSMLLVVNLIERFGPVDIPVLITGETGTGKELVARALHSSSPRRDAPFVEINCGALNEALIESELFGHRRGAFTGAQFARKGLFVEAGEGTLFLDEIGEISSRLQVALLRVLETGDIRPLGGNESVQIQCRVIAATNADLEKLVEAGKFRADLLYRLKRLHLQIPPLRQRVLDIEALAAHFVNMGRPAGRTAVLLPRLKSWLRQQPWPGNARELRNCIERMRVLNSDKLVYDLEDVLPSSEQILVVPDSPGRAQPGAAEATPSADRPIQDLLDQEDSSFRRVKRLRAALVESQEMKVQEAARFLGVTRQTASRYLKQLTAEGFIRKVCPNASVQSHYYVINPASETAITR